MRLDRFQVLLGVLVCFAVFNTLLELSLILEVTSPSGSTIQSLSNSITNSGSPGAFYVGASVATAPASWIAALGVWVWRGHVRMKWQEVGFDREVFKLFMKMKGGGTRIQVLKNLESPKDRARIARELGFDWRTIDDHVKKLCKHGFICEKSTYGKVKVYELTLTGRALLGLLADMENSPEKAGSAPPTT